ncbi:MAG: YkgJ family cysteine cluster protein [Desulfobacteraceae bacterium]|nr:YkgJ family cysteine cluster protein [Desulfobacteraceae bacterium]
MELDLEPYFKMYESLVESVDKVFERVRSEYADCVKCEPSCSDCCHALFDLSLIEALYVNHHFNENLKGKIKDQIIEKANKADRQVYKIKRRASKDLDAGRDHESILAELAAERVRCPMLNDADECDLYEFRPITCRLYGIPTAIGGKGHTCGLSGFSEGTAYPTVYMDTINQKLSEISADFVSSIKTTYPKMAEMLIPLSMALLTEYTKEYMGMNVEKDENSSDTQEGVDE